MKRVWLSVVFLVTGACTPPATAPSTNGPPSAVEPALAAAGGETAPSAVASAPTTEPEEIPAPEGPFSTEGVREIVRTHFDELVPCYLEGRKRVEDLAGTIEVRLAIGGDGHVIQAHAATGPTPTKGELIVDEAVVACVTERFETLRFPETGQGIVNLVYPVVFAVE